MSAGSLRRWTRAHTDLSNREIRRLMIRLSKHRSTKTHLFMWNLRAKPSAKLLLPSPPWRGSVTEAGAVAPSGSVLVLFSDLALGGARVCLVAQPLCAQLRGGRDDREPAACFPVGSPLSHINTSTGSASQLTAPPPPPPSPAPLHPGALFYCRLFLHLLPGDTLIVPTAINTSLSMWQPCVPQSPSQRSHWPGDCEKVQQAQDPHIHMEIGGV